MAKEYSGNNPSPEEKMKLLRKAKNMTQAEFAEIMWVSAAKISRIENGEDTYNQDNLNAIRKYFGFLELA